GSQSPMSQMHIRMLLGQMHLHGADLDMLAIQLTAALDGPLLSYLSASDLTATPGAAERIGQSWQDLAQRVCRPWPGGAEGPVSWCSSAGLAGHGGEPRCRARRCQGATACSPRPPRASDQRPKHAC